MYDTAVLIDRLTSALEALERIPRRFAGIESPDDFHAGNDGIDRMDAICMILIAVGEEFKQIDRKTGGNLLERYPNVEWQGVKGVRNVLAHGYFDVDVEELYSICKNDIPVLIETVKTMVKDLKDGTAP
ncbi:MAG: hypothetical protein FD174_2102 [Geobacteraceae bacterium]|nr:MAG: hypothetical protein FD174_2102 [Geobacteraceae bacterium]